MSYDHFGQEDKLYRNYIHMGSKDVVLHIRPIQPSGTIASEETRFRVSGLDLETFSRSGSGRLK